MAIEQTNQKNTLIYLLLIGLLFTGLSITCILGIGVGALIVGQKGGVASDSSIEKEMGRIGTDTPDNNEESQLPLIKFDTLEGAPPLSTDKVHYFEGQSTVVVFNKNMDTNEFSPRCAYVELKLLDSSGFLKRLEYECEWSVREDGSGVIDIRDAGSVQNKVMFSCQIEGLESAALGYYDQNDKEQRVTLRRIDFWPYANISL